MPWSPDTQCQFCKHWTRHEPRDAGGYCELNNDGFAMEDNWCAGFERLTQKEDLK